MASGLHSGQRVELTLRPAPVNTGMVFRRVDLPEPVDIPVNTGAVCDCRMATTISPGGDPGLAKVDTIEHLMSACAGLGLDNLYVDITAEEVPILDGSVGRLRVPAAKRRHRAAKSAKKFLRVLKPVEVREGEGRSLKWARLEPYHGYKLTFEIDFDHPAVDQTGQRVEFDFSTGQYKRDIARARPFGFTKDVEMMRSRGLGLGASMDNAIVVDEHRVLNADGLRYDDEFVKRKILDAIGDLYVAGHPLLAAYTGLQVGPRPEQPAAACPDGAARRLGDRHLRGTRPRPRAAWPSWPRPGSAEGCPAMVLFRALGRPPGPVLPLEHGGLHRHRAAPLAAMGHALAALGAWCWACVLSV